MQFRSPKAFIILCACALACFLTASAFAARPTTLPDQLKTDDDVPVLLEFYAEWCTTCKRMIPVLHQIQFDTRDKLRIVRMDIDRAENERLSNLFQVAGTPSYFLFDKNGNLVFQMEDYISSSLLQVMTYKQAGVIHPVKLPKWRGASFNAIENNKKPFILVEFHEDNCVPCVNANTYTEALENHFKANLSVVELNLKDRGVKRYMERFSIKSVPSYVLIDEDGFLLFQQDSEMGRQEKKGLWQYMNLVQSGQPKSSP